MRKRVITARAVRVLGVVLIAFLALSVELFTRSNAAPVPSAPADVTVVPAEGRATVSWKPPSSGAPILRYTVTASRGAQVVNSTVAGTVTTTVVSGLASGLPYRFWVSAENSHGAGSASKITPAYVTPGPPSDDAVVSVECTRTTSPTASISAALEATAPGETLCLRAGVYRQGLTITRSGTADARITIASAPGETAIFDGSDLSLDSTSSVVDVHGDHVTLANVEVRNSTGRGVTLSGVAARLSGSKVHDAQYNGVVAGGEDQTIDNNEVWNTVLSNVDGQMGGSGWAEAVNTWRASNTTIRDNYIHDNWGEGIDFIDSNGGSAHYNLVVDNFSVLIYIDGSSNISVVGNELMTTTTKYHRSSAPFGVLIAAEGGGNVDNININNNRLSHTSGISTWDVKPSNYVVYDNAGA